jgi:hypothetical protein
MDMEVKYHKYVPEKSAIYEAGDTFLMSDFVRLIRTQTLILDHRSIQR